MKAAVVLKALWRQNPVIPAFLAVLLVVNVLLYLSVAYVYGPRVGQLQQQLLRQQAQLRDLELRGEAQVTPRAIYRQGQQDLEAFYAAIPPREDLSRLIGELFHLAGEAGLSIERITYDPQRLREAPLLGYTLVFSVNGNYEQLKRFVFSLEHSPRIIALDEISFSGGDAARRTTTLNLRFTTYFQANDA
ncbi:type 4a pilus biogenesis protein PilO [Geoalkalibacter halelectricus]|uniref:Type 4a pilus biogenesis protein PilO n=1 Tax=Geoalkalibacter halelectricus TaxID=2847045 RepID=A0ABY5ZTD6_9BACT|nr:type 4a pilus biogenesis protein PilO [Geoalkalibacter halelectricus]UWZ81175.1 type 4a pilus biogenesis protein PilO [Geoalkalibacter halelectricus]